MVSLHSLFVFWFVKVKPTQMYSPKSFIQQYSLKYEAHVTHNYFMLGVDKIVMQGKLIAVAYTLRTYWNQFSLGGICKQE